MIKFSARNEHTKRKVNYVHFINNGLFSANLRVHLKIKLNVKKLNVVKKMNERPNGYGCPAGQTGCSLLFLPLSI